MGRYATDQDVRDLQDALQPYVDGVSGASTAITTLYRAQASMRLNVYLDAVAAYMNVSASAASSYSSAVGSSVQKRAEDDAKAAMDAAWAALVEICARGGQTIPSIDDSVAFWDMSV
jgi:hypothetical protein